MDNLLPKRKHPSHGIKMDKDECPIIFLIVCTKNRLKWLADGEVHLSLRHIWQKSNAWCVNQYLLMPDHIHLFAFPGPTFVPFDNWVRYWKSLFTKQHKNPEHQWQPDHWDTRIRSFEHFKEKWEYVYLNPVRHQLVLKPEDWPFQGEIYHYS